MINECGNCVFWERIRNPLWGKCERISDSGMVQINLSALGHVSEILTIRTFLCAEYEQVDADAIEDGDK